MKKLFVLGIFIVFSFALFAQKVDESAVPSAVVNNFKMKYANAKDVKWEKEDTVYSAEFLLDDFVTESEFNEKGVWIETEWDIPIEYTPQAIKNYIDSAHAGFKIKELTVAEFPTDGKLYVADISKGKKTQKIYFTVKNEFKKEDAVACSKKKKCCKKKKEAEKTSIL
jgi:hypothetical protein